MVNGDILDAFLGEVDCAGYTVVGDNLILDIVLGRGGGPMTLMTVRAGSRP